MKIESFNQKIWNFKVWWKFSISDFLLKLGCVQKQQPPLFCIGNPRNRTTRITWFFVCLFVCFFFFFIKLEKKWKLFSSLCSKECLCNNEGVWCFERIPALVKKSKINFFQQTLKFHIFWLNDSIFILFFVLCSEN